MLKCQNKTEYKLIWPLGNFKGWTLPQIIGIILKTIMNPHIPPMALTGWPVYSSN